MELAIVGGLCGAGFVTSALLWHLQVRPEVVLSLWDDEPRSGVDPKAALRALRVLLGVAVLSLGFVTGAVLAFLSATRAG